MPRDEVLPLTSKVSVGVRRKLSEIKKITLLSEIRMYMFPDNCQLKLLRLVMVDWPRNSYNVERFYFWLASTKCAIVNRYFRRLSVTLLKILPYRMCCVIISRMGNNGNDGLQYCFEKVSG